MATFVGTVLSANLGNNSKLNPAKATIEQASESLVAVASSLDTTPSIIFLQEYGAARYTWAATVLHQHLERPILRPSCRSAPQ